VAAPDDEVCRRAYLLAQNGLRREKIAEQLGVQVEEMSDILDRGIPLVLAEIKASPAHRSVLADGEPAGPEHREDDARLLLGGGLRITIEVPEDPASDCDYLMTYDDIASHAFPDLVAASVSFVRTLPGISESRQDDREVVCLWGAIDPQAVSREIQRWWHTQLRQR
jgi:hypothetical protein